MNGLKPKAKELNEQYDKIEGIAEIVQWFSEAKVLLSKAGPVWHERAENKFVEPITELTKKVDEIEVAIGGFIERKKS